LQYGRIRQPHPGAVEIRCRARSRRGELGKDSRAGAGPSRPEPIEPFAKDERQAASGPGRGAPR
jgi:hypothetical protein